MPRRHAREFRKRRLMEATVPAFTGAPDTYPPGRAVTGPTSPDPRADLKHEGTTSTDADTGPSSFVVLAMGGPLARLMQSASAGLR